MADTVEKFNTVIYSYKELAEALPQASETFIKDYMLNKQNLEGFGDTTDAEIKAIIALIAIIQAEILVIQARLDAIEARLDYLEGSLSVTDVDLTTSGNHTVICTAEVTITLSAAPLDKDVVRIKQTDFKVFIDGNGRNIDGSSSLTIRKRNTKLKTGLDFIYSADLNGWFVI